MHGITPEVQAKLMNTHATKPGAAPGPRPHPRPAAAAWAAVPLVALAGCVDAIGWLRLQEMFVSFISGTSTMLGIAAVRADQPRAEALALVIILFAAGALLGEVIGQMAGRRRSAAVLGTVAALLGVALLLPAGNGLLPGAACAMVPAMGMLNTALPGISGITFVTGALSRAAAGLVQAAAGQASHLAWLQQAACWGGLVAGAALGAALQFRFGDAALLAPMLAALVAAVVAWRQGPG
jgi:uncharacterized membrane protein YoaK (UPF0700 family)